MDADRVVRELFDFAGLSWSVEVTRFLHESQNSKRRYRYYSVYRGPGTQRAVGSPRDVLTSEEERRILEIVSDSAAMRLFD